MTTCMIDKNDYMYPCIFGTLNRAKRIKFEYDRRQIIE